MAKIRRCDNRCHSAKGTRCKCWCGGTFHGTAGAINREALLQAVTEADRRRMLEQHGFKEGKTAFIEQTKLPIEVV